VAAGGRGRANPLDAQIRRSNATFIDPMIRANGILSLLTHMLKIPAVKISSRSGSRGIEPVMPENTLIP
jgi:hypothetical protein